jgi:hypothetical protein
MMNKKAKGSAIIIILLLAVAAFGVYWFFFKDKKGAGPDLYGEVNAQGECVGRQGMDIVMCCGKYDSAGELQWIPCESAIDQSQAILTTGGTTYNIDTVLFSVKVTNDGSNIPISAKVSSVSTTGGTTAGQAEFNGAWQSVVNLAAKNLGVGAEDTFSMTTTTPIRLSSPTFTMPDGTYTSNIYVTGTGGGKTVTNSKAITMSVSQATVGFQIAVNIVG